MSNIAAVVLGAELNGLGVVRSLGRAGAPVIVVDTDLDKPGMRTRYGKKHRVASMDGQTLVTDLIVLGQSFTDAPVLFITQEATVQTISEYRDQLKPYYRLTLPERECIDLLTDKAPFQRFAEEHNFRVPRTLNVVDEASLQAAEQLRFPVVLKPAKRNAAYSHSFEKAYRVDDFNDLFILCRRILPVCANLIVQEWIEGRDSDIYFCLQYIGEDGVAVASFAGRKIRSWPPQTGGTASCVAAPAEMVEELTSETARFFRAAGFTGMGSMEYKWDSVTGALYLIEPTVGRTDFQEEVATLNGVNIPFASWRAAIGMEVPVQTQVDGAQPVVVWRNTLADRRSAGLQQQRCGRGILDSGKKVDGWWRWYDPVPAAVIFWRRIGPAVRKRAKRIGLFRRATS